MLSENTEGKCMGRVSVYQPGRGQGCVLGREIIGLGREIIGQGRGQG